MKKILLYGYGNIGRQDDGLGILLVERIEELALRNGFTMLDFEANYQLNIEDALTISQYDIVFFADASVNQTTPVKIAKVEPSAQTEFTMHAMDPSFILHLCGVLYDASPETYIITIRASEFEFGQSITAEAAQNLEAAIAEFGRQLSVIGGKEFALDWNNEIVTLNH
ncbi:MAG: hydrogenase maturation protease [Cyclobacteriaceae bacterium]|nr:hydrogenase maturation protease [Cyclobacteriaceae bacterium]